MNKKLQAFILITKQLQESTLSGISDEMREIFQSSPNMHNHTLVFANSSSMFNFIRDTHHKELKITLRDMYENNNIVTQKTDNLFDKIKSSTHIFLMDYFGIDPLLIKTISDIAMDRKIIALVLNPDQIGFSDNVIFPYGTLVNNIIANGATDDELLIYLSINHNITNHELSKKHLALLRHHLKNFQDQTFVIKGSLPEFRKDILEWLNP